MSGHEVPELFSYHEVPEFIRNVEKARDTGALGPDDIKKLSSDFIRLLGRAKACLMCRCLDGGGWADRYHHWTECRRGLPEDVADGQARTLRKEIVEACALIIEREKTIKAAMKSFVDAVFPEDAKEKQGEILANARSIFAGQNQ